MLSVNPHYQMNNNNNKLSTALSTKLWIDDYNSFLILTKLEYEAQLIKEKSPSELLLIFTIHRLLIQLHNNGIHYLLEEQEQDQQQQERPKQSAVSRSI
jgi:hypothetical protein